MIFNILMIYYICNIFTFDMLDISHILDILYVLHSYVLDIFLHGIYIISIIYHLN